MEQSGSLIPAERIERAILLMRGQKIILDKDLANLYEVPTRTLNQAVKRNLGRFPVDFMFRQTWAEVGVLRSQFVTLELGRSSGLAKSGSARGTVKRGSHSKYRPYAFTEQGVAMLSSVLRSERAVLVNVEIMRAFVRMRQILASHADLARKLDALEKKYDIQFKAVFDAIRQLMAPPAETKKGKIGFAREKEI